MYINYMLLVVPNTVQHCCAVVQRTLSGEGMGWNGDHVSRSADICEQTESIRAKGT